jgi:membrane protease YdiL (CAAX protease family)
MWATVGFSLLTMLATVLAQAAVVVAYMAIRNSMEPGINVQRLAQEGAASGLVLSASVLVSLPLELGLIVLWIKLRSGCTLRGYLALRPVPWLHLFGWLGATLAWIVCMDGVTYLLGRPIVPPFMEQAYRTVVWPPLLWMALVIGAPLLEETLFRGFLLVGLRPRIGSAGAVIVAAVAWALLHVQYDALGISMILATGLLLGAARIRSASLYPPLAMHALLNFVATLEAACWPAK